MFTRRDFFITSVAASALLAIPVAAKPTTRRFDATARLQKLEIGPARLGVCFLDTSTGETSGNRMEESFALCSTFKLALVSAILREADQGRMSLDDVLA